MARTSSVAELRKRLAAIVQSDNVGGRTARHVLPYAVGASLAAGLLLYAGVTLGLFGVGPALFAAVFLQVTLLVAAIVRAADLLNAEEAERKRGEKKAAQAIKRKTSALEKRAAAREEELTNEKNKAETLLECIGDGVFVIDRLWVIRSWNAAAEKISGFSKKDAIGANFRDIVKFVREADRKPNLAFIEECMLFGRTQFIETHTLMIRKDGSEVAVGDSASPVLDGAGKVIGAIIVFRDASKEAELEMARQEFASLATHQLRTPITVIKGYAELLHTDDTMHLTDRQNLALTGIEKAAERLNALVTGMLNVTRVESGTIDIAPEPTDLSVIADDVLREMEQSLTAKKMQVVRKYDKDVPQINVDPRLIGAIYRNLLSNAVKYTPEGGTVTVGIGKTDRYAVVSVADTGYGIPKAQQHKMFGKFFRGDNVRKKDIEGTGLGLFLVKTILEGAGGGISFTSEENKGTTFTVHIPLSGMKRREGTKGLS